MPITKLRIPHPLEPGCELVGLLETKESSSVVSAESSIPRRKVALIVHGTMGHKNYLHHRLLAQALDIDSFRFDFRGNAESSGAWTMGAFERDVEDLEVVAKHMREGLGYVIDLVVGHSRGAITATRWITVDAKMTGSAVPKFASLNPRFRMEKIHDRDAVYSPEIARSGYYPWTVKVAGSIVTGHITAQAIAEFASFDNTYAREEFPRTTSVLNMGAEKDAVVPPWDAFLWQRALQGREASTTLHIVKDADHNMIGFFPEVVQTICDWCHMIDRQGEGSAPPVWDPALAEPFRSRL